MKANQDNCHILSRLDISTKFSLPACILENSVSRKLLGVTIDRKLNFNEHVTNLCDKASRKLQPFARIFPYIPPNTKTTFNECISYVSVWLLSFSLNELQ